MSFLKITAALMIFSSANVFSANAQVAAKVKGRRISKTTVENLLQNNPGTPEQGSKEYGQAFAITRDQVVLSKLLTAFTRERKKEILSNKQARKSYREAITMLLMKLFTDDFLKTNVTEELLQKTYDDMPHDQLRLSRIVVEDKDLADRVIKGLKSGRSFAKLAQEKSIDESTAKNGGFFTTILSTMVPPPLEMIKSWKVGEFSQDPLPTGDGKWFILKLDGRSEASFEEARPSLVELAKASLQAQLMKDVIENSIADVELFDMEGNSSPTEDSQLLNMVMGKKALGAGDAKDKQPRESRKG